MENRAGSGHALERILGGSATLVVSLAVYGAAGLAAWLVLGQAMALAPWLQVLIGMSVATLVVFLFASAFGNASIYDPFWSVAPPLVLLHLIWHSAQGSFTTRHLIVLTLVSAWSLRLTGNCLRRWRSLRDEDFRYRDLRAKSGKWFWAVNLFGIEFFPTLLVWLGCLPMIAIASSTGPLNGLDIMASLAMASAILLEMMADAQLWRHRQSAGSQRSALTSGLWQFSQHPNYLGEMLFWWSVWLFGIAASTASWWTVTGALAMTGLFVFISVPMMLARKRSRIPEYDRQVRGIPVLFPRLARRRPSG